MSDAFDALIGPLLAREGGYSNNPADAGGETNWGVTAAVARASGYSGAMDQMSQAQAAAIYRGRFWSAPRLDQLSAVSAPVAAKLFDMGVNMGPAVGIVFLQRALNVLNHGGKDYADLPTSGMIGALTLAALGAFIKLRGAAGEAVLLKAINCLEGARYVALAEERPANEAFEYGWLANRIN